jgi:hypothetical protein
MRQGKAIEVLMPILETRMYKERIFQVTKGIHMCSASLISGLLDSKTVKGKYFRYFTTPVLILYYLHHNNSTEK